MFYCECATWKQSQISQLLIYWFIWRGCGVCLFFYFHSIWQAQLEFWASGNFWGNFQSAFHFSALVVVCFVLFFVIGKHGKCQHVMFDFKLCKCKSNTLTSAFPLETFEYPCKLWRKKKAEKNQSLKLKVCFCLCSAEFLSVELQTQGCEFISALNCLICLHLEVLSVFMLLLTFFFITF